jgi:hypothetical protein
VLKCAAMSANPYQAPTAELRSAEPRAGAAPALWNPDAVGNWSLLFTPVFGAVLIARNWQALGEPKRASRARIWAWLAPPIVLVGGAFPLLIAWYFASNRPQARLVKQRWGSDYPRKPWAGALALGFAVWLGLVLAYLAAYLLVKDPAGPRP